MRVSEYMRTATFLWEGRELLKKITLAPQKTTLCLSDRAVTIAERAWELRCAGWPGRYRDGRLWRYESSIVDFTGLRIMVSPVRYAMHSFLRKMKDRPMEYYPNPIGVNTIQETADGYILVGRRTGHTDEGSSLHLLGSGFIDRDRHHTVEDAVRAECHEETRYRSDPFPAENALALALVFGSNHDTGVTVHLPLPVDSHEVDLKGDEHSDLLLLPKRAIPFVLHNGKMKGIRCVDQMIGSLEAYFLYVRQG